MTVRDNEKIYSSNDDSITVGYVSSLGVDYNPDSRDFYLRISEDYPNTDASIALTLETAKAMHEHLGTLIADYEADKPAVPKNSDIIAGLKPGSIFTLEGPGLVHTWVRIIGGARNVANDSQCSAFYLWDNDDTNLVVVFENTN